MLHAHHGPDLVHAVAARIDHDVTIDITVLCIYGPCIVPVLDKLGYGGVAIDLCPGLAGMKGKRLAELGRIDIAVFAIPKSTEEVLGGNKRMAARAFFGIDHLVFHAHTACHRREMPIGLHLLFGVGQANAAIAVMISDRILRIVPKLLVKGDGVRLQANHCLRHAEIRYLCRRMPCGAGC